MREGVAGRLHDPAGPAEGCHAFEHRLLVHRDEGAVPGVCACGRELEDIDCVEREGAVIVEVDDTACNRCCADAHITGGTALGNELHGEGGYRR